MASPEEGKTAELEWQLSTLACHAGSEPEQWSSRDVVPPISLASTFLLDDPFSFSGFSYTRRGNPTRQSLEKCLAAVEGAKHACTYSSGLAALLNLTYLLRAHDHVVSCADLYGGAYRFLTRCASRMAIETSFVDVTNLAEFKQAFRPNTKLVWLESVSNPTMKLIDLKELVRVTREIAPSAIVAVDNTFLTACLYKPLDHGADIAHYSITKYVSGHSDVLMGALVLNDDKLADELRKLQCYMGSVPSPIDCFLANRGLRTLELRMRRHSESGLLVARALQDNLRIERVLHPGLESHPQYELACQILPQGSSGVFSCYIRGDRQQTKLFLKSLKVFSLAFSLGGHESLVTLPIGMTHRDMPEEERQAIGVTDNLVRVSIGLEDPRDLIRDLEQALRVAIPLQEKTASSPPTKS